MRPCDGRWRPPFVCGSVRKAASVHVADRHGRQIGYGSLRGGGGRIIGPRLWQPEPQDLETLPVRLECRRGLFGAGVADRLGVGKRTRRNRSENLAAPCRPVPSSPQLNGGLRRDCKRAGECAIRTWEFVWGRTKKGAEPILYHARRPPLGGNGRQRYSAYGYGPYRSGDMK